NDEAFERFCRSRISASSWALDLKSEARKASNSLSGSVIKWRSYAACVDAESSFRYTQGTNVDECDRLGDIARCPRAGSQEHQRGPISVIREDQLFASHRRIWRRLLADDTEPPLQRWK